MVTVQYQVHFTDQIMRFHRNELECQFVICLIWNVAHTSSNARVEGPTKT